MKKESLGFYIFRLMVSFSILTVLCLVYWSSVLNEQHLIELKSEIQTLKRDISESNGSRQKSNQYSGEQATTQSPMVTFPKPLPQSDENQETKTQTNLTSNSQTSANHSTSASSPSAPSTPTTTPTPTPALSIPTLPNLLTPDPFYAKTLPEMLGPNFRPRGTFQRAAMGKPENLHPFSNWANVNEWVGMCSVSAARGLFGKYETMAPDMAIKIEERPSGTKDVPEYWVHLRDGVYWQPLNESMFPEGVKLAPHFLKKHQVTAHDFKFYFDALMNPYNQEPGAVASRTLFSDIEEIKVIDNLTFVVRWKVHEIPDDLGNLVPKIRYIAKQLSGGLTPLASFVYKYFADGTKIIEDDSDPETYRTNSIWAQNFAQHWAKNIIVSCGPWIFVKMTDQQIQFRRNPDHYFPLDVLAERTEFSIKNTPDAVWQDFKSGRIDHYTLQPDQQVELKNFLNSDFYKNQEKNHLKIERLDYLTRSYNYIGWNMARPYFESKKVRQAMTMAIDRNRIVNQILNGMGIQLTGPFAQFSPSYDTTIAPWPFDPQMSKELLEAEGWYDSDGDGIVDKEINGKRVPFEFHLTYFVKNPTTKAICEYVAMALKEIGVRCLLNGVDIADLSAMFDEKNFDAYCLGWGQRAPPEDPRQLWHSEGARQPGSSNAVGFVNAEADKIIDALAFESNPKKRIELYHRFHKIIHEEQPYTFLYAPKTVMLYREYLQNVFIPADRQDLVPGANVGEPSSAIFWIKR